MLKIIALLLPLLAQANAIDEWGRDELAWRDAELAENISDWSVAAAAALPLLGADNWEQRGAISVGYAAGAAVNFGVKALELRERPNGRDRASFYSGHTGLGVAAVVGAVLTKKTAIIIPTAVLAVAVPVGRIGSRNHWVTDCLYSALVSWLIAEKAMLSVGVRF